MSADEVASYLEVNGRILAGEEFEEYCKDHGLCRRCAKTKTHRRVVKMFGRGRKWEPLTLHDDLTGEYTVYKGHCLQPGCYTMGQAKRLLGESESGRRSSRGDALAARMKGARRPGRRKARSNPETGSVMSTMDDDMSIASDVSGASNRSSASAISVMSNLSGLSGLAGYRRRRRNKRSSTASTGSSVSSGLSSLDEDDVLDDDMTVDSTMTKDMNPIVDDGEINPIVAHRVEQLTRFDYFTILDLSKVTLRKEDIEAMVNGISEASSLEGIILDRCKLRDDDVKKILQAFRVGGSTSLKRLSLRQNSIGNRGAESLVALLTTSDSLEELDLSENAISSRGAEMILDSLHRNSKCALHTLNLSQNEIWDLGGSEFLRGTRTLKVLNLDGNFMHDEGACTIANAIAQNRDTVIEKLYLGWNGISDEGCTALAKMLEMNATLRVLGLAENDITNIGARAILSALSINHCVREISGLYHNQIDRKFIIVAIKRLLQRIHERGGAGTDAYNVSQPDNCDARFEESKVEEGNEDGSEGSTNWADQMFSAPGSVEQPRVAIEAMEQWDWGTFGIDEIESSMRSQGLPPPMVDVTDSDDGEDLTTKAPEARETKRSRISFFRSAPLAFFDRKTSQHHDVPLLDFDFEKKALEDLFNNKSAIGADIELIQEIATEERMKDVLSRGTSPILHFTGYGQPDCLALENGFGYLQALPRDALKNMIMLNQEITKVVVVSAVHALNTANLLLSAGFKHVVCCQREMVYHDEGVVEFAKAFYSSLARNKTLKEAFDQGVEAVNKSSSKTLTKKTEARFLLLPKKAASSEYHNINVLFEKSWPKRPACPQPDTTMLPPLPSPFVGREVDMYEILESLRVDDVVRVGGSDGSGKVTLLSAVSHYILARPASFGIGAVYWLPPPPDVFPEEDTCYGDFAQVMDLLVEAEDDIWDEELYSECRERIMVELEHQRTILVIDGRMFDSEAAGENLERFLSYLLNEVSVKIILITAHEGHARTKRSRSEETMITVGPLDFKSTAFLFGESCPHVSPLGNSMAHTADEFASIVVASSIKNRGTDDNKGVVLSPRQQDLYDRMGRGNPKAIVETATTMSPNDFMELLQSAHRRPELHVRSAEELQRLVRTVTAQQEKAIQGRNVVRARDLGTTLEELDRLQSKFPSVDNLANKENDLKNQYLEHLKARRYDAATQMKRQLLELKREMLKEKFAKPANGSRATTSSGSSSTTPASDKLRQLQAKRDALRAAAATLKISTDDQADVIFDVVRSDGESCHIRISQESLVDDHTILDGMLGGIVCWTNECCDLSTYPVGQQFLQAAGTKLVDDIEDIETIADTPWGAAKISMGSAELLGPSTYSNLSARYVILAVPPLSPSKNDTEFDVEADDDDALHYLETTLRTSYRSTFRWIKKSGMDAVAIPTISTQEGGRMYQRTLQIGLETLVEEAKTSKLNNLHYMATTGTEARLLIKLAAANGFIGA